MIVPSGALYNKTPEFEYKMPVLLPCDCCVIIFVTDGRFNVFAVRCPTERVAKLVGSFSRTLNDLFDVMILCREKAIFKFWSDNLFFALLNFFLHY